MILEAMAIYWGLSDLVEVVAWVEEDDGEDLHKSVKTIIFDLFHNDTVMYGISGNSTHYTKTPEEEKGSFRSFFMHPPIQHHQYVRVSVELMDGRAAQKRSPVTTEKSLRRHGDELANPMLGGRGSIAYPLPVEKVYE